jgi:hypothetical protein
MREVGVIVRSHHERWDGEGYPDGLAGDAIPLEARIIACCDSWNAMRTTRPYRRALPYETAVAELTANAGGQFDPRIAAAVLTIESSAHCAAAETAAAPPTGPAPTPDPGALRLRARTDGQARSGLLHPITVTAETDDKSNSAEQRQTRREPAAQS